MKIKRVRKELHFPAELERLGRRLQEGTRSQLLAQLGENEHLYGIYLLAKEEKIAHYLGNASQREIRYFQHKLRLVGYFALGRNAREQIFEEVDPEEVEF